MSIEKALEKAKQGRDTDGGLHHGSSTGSHYLGGASTATQRIITTRTRSLGPAPAIREQPTAIVNYDRDVCEEHRILVPGVEPPGPPHTVSAFRMMRTRVLTTMRENNWSTLAITSPGPGEGKSVTSLNLALSIARERNSNVFLLDLDMRNPSICRYLGLRPQQEISKLFTGTASPRDVLFSIGVENLCLAGGVGSTDLASELLASGQLEQLFDYIQEIAPRPFIIADLPPVLNTDDFLVVAPKLDATLLVVSEGRTRRDALSRTLEIVSNLKVAGVVLNRTRETLGSYYYAQSGY